MHVAFLKFTLNARFFNIFQKGCSKTEVDRVTIEFEFVLCKIIFNKSFKFE